MKFVVVYDAAGEEAGPAIRERFPAHQAWYQSFADRGELLMIGPFTDRRLGALAVFATREAAERFVAGDPFVTNGIVPRWEIREWNEALVS